VCVYRWSLTHFCDTNAAHVFERLYALLTFPFALFVVLPRWIRCALFQQVCEKIREDGFRPKKAAENNQWVKNPDCKKTQALIDKYGPDSKIVEEVERAWEEHQRYGLEADSAAMIRGIPWNFKEKRPLKMHEIILLLTSQVLHLRKQIDGDDESDEDDLSDDQDSDDDGDDGEQAPLSQEAIETLLRRYKKTWQHVVLGHEDSQGSLAARNQAAGKGGCGGCAV
jgi:hypothetical protein